MAWTGDWLPLERLVAEQLPAALAFAQRLTGDAERAEELVQESLYRAARAWPAFRGQSQPRTWLYRIIVNVFRDQAERKPADELPADQPDRTAADPAELASAAELGQRVARLVSSLPPRQREVLVLLTYEGLSVSEAASTLGITEANVHATLHVARARLKKQLEAFYTSR